jgi:hypothetical protein
MDELKAYLEEGFTEETQEKTDKDKSAPKKKSVHNAKNIELAKMYNDAAEYEEELELFEQELEIVNANILKNIPEELSKKLPDEGRDYNKELKDILVSTWTHMVETQKTHPVEQLELISETELCDVVEKLSAMYPDNDFEAEIKSILVKRLEILISIKQEHIQEEIDDIYIAGLKPSYVKRIHKQVNGLA